MELALYLLGNWLCLAAAYNVVALVKNDKDRVPDTMSKDTMICLFIGSVVRIYWGSSPPAIWDEEPVVLEWLCKIDLVVTVCIWAYCAFLVSSSCKEVSETQRSIREEEERLDNQTDKRAQSFLITAQKKCNWITVLLTSAVVGFVVSLFLPSLHTEEAFPLLDFSVVFGTILDGMALVPQILLIAKSVQVAPPQSGSFVGCLCLGRVFRMMFWVVALFHPECGMGLVTFLVPDLVHTVVMGEYLYEWLKKTKSERIDPFLQNMVNYV